MTDGPDPGFLMVRPGPPPDSRRPALGPGTTHHPIRAWASTRGPMPPS